MREKVRKIIGAFDDKYQYDVEETSKDWIIYFDNEEGDEFLFSIPVNEGLGIVMIKKERLEWDKLDSESIDELIKYAKESLKK